MAGIDDLIPLAVMAWSGLGIFGIIIIIGGFIAIFAKIYFDKKDYNKKALIIRHYGNVRIPLADVFKFVFDRSKNIKYYYGKKSKAKIPAETWEGIEKDENNKDFLILDNVAPDEYIPIQVKDVGLEPIISTNKKAWYVYAHRDNINRFEILDWLGKYANVIALAGIVILMLISFIFQGALLDKVNNGLAVQNVYADNLRGSADIMLKSNEILYQSLDKAVNLSLMLRNMDNINKSSQVIER